MSAQPALAALGAWVRDDQEEDLVGADWHQENISSLVNGLRRLAQAQGWPWHVGNQLTLLAWHPDGTPWSPCPDVLVHATAGPRRRERLDAREEGLPALLIEVASPSTWRRDVGVARRNKRDEYLALGVAEYLVFDPTGDLLPQRCQAWRLQEGREELWLPDAEGRYHSALGVAFAPEGLFLRAYDPAGVPLRLDHEIGALERRSADLEQEIAVLRAELDRLRGEDRD